MFGHDDDDSIELSALIVGGIACFVIIWIIKLFGGNDSSGDVLLLKMLAAVLLGVAAFLGTLGAVFFGFFLIVWIGAGGLGFVASWLGLVWDSACGRKNYKTGLASLVDTNMEMLRDSTVWKLFTDVKTIAYRITHKGHKPNNDGE